MATRISKITLKNMSAKNFENFIKELGACNSGLKWAKGKTLRKAWETCNDEVWMWWLLKNISEIGDKNFPSEIKVEAIIRRGLDVNLKKSPAEEIKFYRKYVEVV